MTLVAATILAAVATEIIGASLIEWNTALNVAALGALALAAFRIGSTNRLRGAVADLDAVVKAKDEKIKALEDKLDDVLERVAAAEARAVNAEKEAAAAVARHEELSRYTSAEAFNHFEKIMAEHREQVRVRHEQIIAGVAQTEKTVVTALQANHAILLELLSRLTEHE